MVESQIVDLVVAGSNPVIHPKELHYPFAPIAHLDRVPDFESGGSLFESGWARKVSAAFADKSVFVPDAFEP